MAVTVRYGSQGDDVKRLQQTLNRAGYGLTVDGIFGNNTLNAVKSYQQKNGLAADGIVGNQTWGKLLGGGTSPAQAAATAANATNPEPEAPQLATTARGTQYNPAEQGPAAADLNALEGGMPTYQQSQALTDALASLTGLQAAKPAAHESPYSQQIADMYDRITSRQPFEYDPNGDPLYQMYRDRYTENARRSMQDTMADAAALTGGYGNSYAAAAAQQAYDRQMNGLNDALPELYGQAYQRWQGEGDELRERLALLRDLENTEYGRYSDSLADWYDRLNAERTLANDMYSREYGQYADRLNAWQADRAYYADKAAQEQAAALAALAGSSGGGGGRSGGGSAKSSGSGSAGTSKDYKTIAATAAQMSNQKAYDYIGRMVDAGYITQDEGFRILELEMGIDMTQYTTNDGSGGNSGMAAGMKVDPKIYEVSGLGAYQAGKTSNALGLAAPQNSGTSMTEAQELLKLLRKGTK